MREARVDCRHFLQTLPICYLNQATLTVLIKYSKYCSGFQPVQQARNYQLFVASQLRSNKGSQLL